MASNRKILVVALTTTLLACSGDGGKITGSPPPPPPTQPPPPPPPTDVVSVTILFPTPSQSIVQTAMPGTPVDLKAEAMSSLRGKIDADSLLTWTEGETVLGKGGSLSYAFLPGPHNVCFKAKSPVSTEVESKSCQTFTIAPASPILFELSRDPVDGVGINCTDYRAYVSNQTIVDSADVDGNCIASVSPRIYLLPTTGRVSVWVDAKNHSTRSHFPSYQPNVSKDSLRIKQGFVLPPLKDPLTSGRWTGMVADIDLEKACQQVLTPLGLDSFFRCGNENLWQYILPTWSEPPQAAFDHDSTLYVPSAFDSSEVWRAFSGINDMIGREIMRSASQADLGIITRFNGEFKGIRMFYHNGIAQGSSQKVDGFTIVSGNILIPSNMTGVFAYQPVLGHEEIHAFGFGHTVAWGISLMNPNPQVSRDDPRYGVMIPEEVAHFRILYSVQEIRRKTGFQYGIAQAHQGQRVLMKGLPSPDKIFY